MFPLKVSIPPCYPGAGLQMPCTLHTSIGDTAFTIFLPAVW